MPGGLELALVGLAAVGAGFVNALAGGGTLITFPALMAVGIPAVAANVTNTVALCPGYLGGIYAQGRELSGQGRRARLLVPAGMLGGLLGGILLLETSAARFRVLVPFLILLASGLLAVQEPLRRWLTRRADGAATTVERELWAVVPVCLAAVYGGYFGAGLSVIVLAVLGLVLNDPLPRLNALKQAIAFSANFAAALLFLFSGSVHWWLALVMALGALAGGTLGGRLAGRVKPRVLRRIVVLIGLIVGVIYLWRQ
jgi:uncharacterized membrane protein YfcA